ncbi:ketoacyl-ACP synthase III [Propioniciclava sp. MC1595]|uniref:beta-ketoacyl-ACP synthase III n=1 Tax=Propioniciclava sp. MC1595 TaxID=2760308 RepID=UPI001662802A|nr:beta-ketoacyl-ACP synthase III [Propioniciclava sp. MC1595]MBB1495702.1 ketoacyl-ACP synthase III [Propioniciclava sp. MC1595]QTE24835.1 ketoacyl-ACP synthase III [Propioniciclava sp. MC1595]
MALKASQGAAYSRVEGIGSAIPSRVVDNHEMTTYIETSDEWIQQRTGIVERRWVGEGETVESLTLEAARNAMEHAGVEATDIDAVIVSTVSHLVQTPSLAAIVAAKLGTDGAAAFDISAACAGFSYGLAQADSLVRSGAARRVVVIGAETLSQITDLHDRATAFLFADGAGAAVVGPSDVPAMGPVVWGSDGDQADVIEMNRDWNEAVATGQTSQITMQGQAVFRWATSFIADAARRTLEASGLTPDELDLFVPHQANNRITDSMLRHLKLPETVTVARTIRNFGNNSAASIPIALDAMIASGEAKSGDTCLIIGFGAGLVYAGQVITIP